MDGERKEGQVQVSMPVAALTFLGVLIAVLGLFVGGNITVTIVGLAAIGFAGILQVMGGRRPG